MAIPTTLPVSLETCLEVCKFMGSLVEPSVYHKNSLALILNASGEVCLTNSGMKIIVETYCSHPLAKLIVGAMKKHHEVTGDGSKSYILLLHEIILSIKKRACGESTTETRNDLSNLMHRILPSVFESIRSSAFVLHHSFESDDSANISKIIKLLITTFFERKYTSLVSHQLSLMLYKLIAKSIVDWMKLPSLIIHLISNFVIICSKSHACLQESCILEGIVIKNPLNKCSTKETSNLKFVVFQSNSNSSSDDDDAHLKLDSNASVCLFLESNHKHYKKFVSFLKSCDISLVLISSNASEEFYALCLQANISLIDRICNEEMQYIISCTNVTPLNDFNEIPQLKNIGYMKFMKDFRCGQKNYLQFGVALPINGFVPHHLILCAPVESLCKEYITECINCLKVIKQWINIENLSNIQDSSSYYSSDTRYTECLENVPVLNYRYASRNSNADGLPTEEQHSRKKFETGNLVGLKWPDIQIANFSVACPAGIWEVIFRKKLDDGKKYFPQSINSLSILCEALQGIITKTHTYSNTFRATLLQECFELPPEFQLHSEANINPLQFLDIDSALEPVASKELLIYNVLSLVIQLLRIDGIISVKK